jgi:hypothetical protein
VVVVADRGAAVGEGEKLNRSKSSSSGPGKGREGSTGGPSSPVGLAATTRAEPEQKKKTLKEGILEGSKMPKNGGWEWS